MRVVVAGTGSAARTIAAGARDRGVDVTMTELFTAELTKAETTGAGVTRAGATRAETTDAEMTATGQSVGMVGAPAPAVPLILHVLAHPTEADTDALRSADLVVCQPLPAGEAEWVARAVGLSPRMATWLAHAEDPMVALIGDGAVRWAMAATDRGLAGARQT
jgi:hypothetical protein